MNGMDEIDRKQQEDITELQKKDVEQGSQFWMFKMILIVNIIGIFLTWMALFMLVLELKK